VNVLKLISLTVKHTKGTVFFLPVVNNTVTHGSYFHHQEISTQQIKINMYFKVHLTPKFFCS